MYIENRMNNEGERMTVGYEQIAQVATAVSAAAVAYILILAFLYARKATKNAYAQDVFSPDADSGLIRALLPIARGLGTMISSFLGGTRPKTIYASLRTRLEKKLMSAGQPQGLEADDYIGFGLLIGLIGGLFGLSFFILIPPTEGVSPYALFIGGVGLGVLWWRSWLVRKRTERVASIRKELPFSLDLLTLSMEAGLDFTNALARMVRKIGKTPLGHEYSILLHEIQLGKTRTQALRDFSNRIDVTEVRTVIGSLIQAEELGSPIAPILRIQSAQQRERRSQRAEEQAMKSPVKLLFPLLIFIFPSTLVVIMAPIIQMIMGVF